MLKTTTMAIAALMASTGLAGAETCKPIEGVAAYNYAEDGRPGVGALSGTIAGAAYVEQVGEFETVDENGRVEADLRHMFVTETGHTIFTNDVSWGYAIPNTDYIVDGGAYTVRSASGQYEGYTGAFQSWGAFWPSQGKAVLRYEGKVCAAE